MARASNSARSPRQISPQTYPLRQHHLFALLGYLALTIVMTWPLTPQFFTAIPGDSFDGWQNYWNLWWVKLALVDRLQNPFFTDILFAPTGVGLYFHTLNPFNGLATLPVQLTGGLIPAYNAVVYLSWTLGGYGVYLLTLYILVRGQGIASGGWSLRPAAFMAGSIFTFSPFHMAHLLGHMQVMSLQWIPFYILYLLRSVDRAAQPGRRWLRDALLAGLFLILTGLCDWYFVLYMVLFTALLVLWRLASVLAARLVHRDRHNKQDAAPTDTMPVGWLLWRTVAPPALAGLLFGIVLAPLLLPMVQDVRAFSFMVRPATDLYILSASLMDFLVPNRLHTLFRPESYGWIGNQIAPVSERTISLGYVPLLLAGVAMGLDRRRTLFWAAVVLFFILMALGPRIHLGNISWEQIPQENTEAVLAEELSPFGLVHRLMPLVRMSRSVSRYALVVQLGVAVAAGVGLAALIRVAAQRRSLTQASRRRLALGAAGAALTLILFEFWVAPYPMSPPDTPDYYAQLDAAAPSGALLNLPMNWDRPGYLLYQTVHQRPLTVAYISREDPRTATDRYPFLQHLRHLGPDILADDPARVGLSVLADLGVGVVTLDRYKMPGGAEREVTEAVAALVFGDAPPLFEDHRITVYGVEPPAVPAPYLALGPLGWGPLEVRASEDGIEETRLRRLREEGAVPHPALWVHHLEQAATLSVRFRGAPGVILEVRTPDGNLHEFAATAAPQSVQLSLAPAGVSVQEIHFLARGGEVEILELALDLDGAARSARNSAGVPSP